MLFRAAFMLAVFFNVTFSVPPVDQALDLHGDPANRFAARVPPAVSRNHRPASSSGHVTRREPLTDRAAGRFAGGTPGYAAVAPMRQGLGVARIRLELACNFGAFRKSARYSIAARFGPLQRSRRDAKPEMGRRCRATRIHHRETPLYLLQGRADAGPVWRTEALYQQRIAHLEMIEIPARDNVDAQYDAAWVRGAAHAAAAREFVSFMESSQARAILASYGFAPPP